MVDSDRTASGRGLARTTESRTPRQAAVLTAALVLAGAVLLALLPAASRSASYEAIQANIQDKQSAIERARSKEGVLTSDISVLSKRIRGLTSEIGALRR